MKEYYHHPRPHRRPLASLRLLLATGAVLLAACTADDALTGAAATTSGTPVAFTAAVESVALPATSSAASSAAPHTRTATAPDGTVEWTQGDAVGIFMLTAGGTTPADILPDAANIKHTATPATGALTSAALIPAATPLYYPQQGTVDFIAYYPYAAAGAGSLTNDYTYRLSLADQSTPAAIDLLRATAAGREKSPTAVSLPFAHVLSKIKLNITLGDGLSALPADKITGATLTGMPASATLSLMEGTLTPGTTASLAARQETAPTDESSITGGVDAPTADVDAPTTAGVDAIFTALVPPHAAQDATPAYPDRSIVVTVDGVTYTAAIPADHVYDANTMYVYPVTVQKSGIILGPRDITVWTTNDHGSNDALYVYTLTYDGNGATAGTVPASQAIDGSTVTLPDATALTPPAGKAFVGWSTTRDVAADADFYRPGDELTLTRHTTLYAIWGGDGASAKNPVLIFDEQGMKDIAGGLTKHYRLMRDITLTDWQPLGAYGDSQTPNTPFTGTFHGGGHTLTINSIAGGWKDYTGIFGEAGPCLIQQLCVAGKIDISNSDIYACGGIAGQAADGCVIENCLVRANLSSTYDTSLGGILGKGPSPGSSGAIVKNCLVLGKLYRQEAYGSIGGIVGNGLNSSIVNCVVLSQEITSGRDKSSNNPRRIGLSNVRFNNYANRDMRAGNAWPGHQWGSAHNGADGAHCDPIPTETWWKTPAHWKTTDGYTAWDFTTIWEFDSNGYPRLRIIQ